ncbi:MAG: bifunctional diaminohydroxyphosphoribosylaminopyrimidine deaminase/5-amino-6-(5-phosphoribosylamino)uracil reductase RibD [Pseudomonadota bacterium]
MSLSDAQHMRRAVALARRSEGFTHPNPMVGCVLVKDGEVVGEGWHRAPGLPHAEVEAMRDAGEDARGATAYVTLEPCNHYGKTPPCSKGLIEAGVAEVVFGIRDLNKEAEGGAATLRKAGIEARLFTGDRDVTTACAELIRPWVHSLTCWRPWVTAKLAMTLDGATATSTGESRWITGPGARARGHDLRQRTGAILVGVETVLADNPGLDARPESREPAPSLKVVLDSTLRTPTSAKFLSTPGLALIFGHEDAASDRAAALETAGAEIALVPGEKGQPDIKEALRLLKDRGVNDLMIEGGGTILGTAFDAGVVDEVWAFVAPMIMGGGRRAVSGQGPDALADAMRLSHITTEQLGPDLLIRGLSKRSA